MADNDEELEGLFEDSSVDEDDIDEFLKMLDDDNSDDLLSDEEFSANDDMPDIGISDSILLEDDEDSSFVSADLESEDDIDSNILDSLDSVGGYKEDVSAIEDKPEEPVFDGFSEINDILAGAPEEAPESNQETPTKKKSFFQKLKALFKSEPTEEQLQLKEAKKQAKEERRLAEEAETSEIDAYEEQVKNDKLEKKQQKAEAKAAAKEAAKAEAESKKAAKEAAKAAKKAEAEKKKQEKEAKKEEKRGPVPKSLIVPIKPLIAFIMIGAALSALLVFGSKNHFYITNVKNAREQFIHQEYEDAYQNMLGLDVKTKDVEFYDQVEIVNRIDNKLKNYRSYKEIGQYEEALDSLLGGVRKYDEYVGKAERLGVVVEFRAIYDEIALHLKEDFNVEPTLAKQMSEMTERDYKNKISAIARDAAIRDGVLSEEDIVNMTEAQNE